MPKIALYENVPQAWFEAFAAFLREHQPVGLALELAQPETDDLDSMLRLVPEADVLVVGLTGQRRAVVRKVFEEAVRLKLLQKIGSRVWGLDLDAAREAGVPVSLLPAPAHIACAEHTMLLILAVAKKLLAANRQMTDGRARKPGREPRTGTAPDYAYNWADLAGIGVLAGKTLGLLGMGDIGIEVACRAKAFGMKVIYHQSEALPQEEQDLLGVGFRELDALLGEADVVSLHAGLTSWTGNVLSAERLALLKPSAIVVNTARGGLVDEAALATALREKLLAGAGIDAWAVEPPPRDNPLLRLDTVVATPHVAAGTLPPSALFELILPNLLAALRGERMASLVVPPRAEPAPALVPVPPEERASDDEPTPVEEPTVPTELPAEGDRQPEETPPSGPAPAPQPPPDQP